MSTGYPALNAPEPYSTPDDASSLTAQSAHNFVKISDGDEMDTNTPCPWCETTFGSSVLYQFCCFCFWAQNDQRKCAIGLLYSKYYLFVYVIIIAITITLVVFDIQTGFDNLHNEAPAWFVTLDILCVALMVIDVILQIMANPREYWKSAANVFDFIVVTICVIGVPIYFYLPQSDIIVTIVLLLRFAAQLLRIIMIWRHQKERRAYINAANNDIVDFSTFQDSADIARNQGIADDGKLIATSNSFNSTLNITKKIREMTPEWAVVDIDENNENNNNNSNNNNNKQKNINEKGQSSNDDNNNNYYPNLNNNDNDNNQSNENSSLAEAANRNNMNNKNYDSFSETERDQIIGKNGKSLSSENRPNVSNNNNNNNNGKDEIDDDNQDYEDTRRPTDDGIAPVVF